MRPRNNVFFFKNYVTDEQEFEVKFILFKYTLKGNTLRI